MQEIKSVKLIGLGAMGCFFAPKLEAVLGENFKVIATGERKKRLQTKGVTINNQKYIFEIADPFEEKNSKNKDCNAEKQLNNKVANDETDLIIIAVKGYSFDEALDDIEPYVGENTVIMSVINGVDSERKAIERYGKEHVIYSYMRVSIVMKDGVTSFDPKIGKVHFGEEKNKEGSYSDRVEAIRLLFEKAEVGYAIDEDMLRGIWFKFSCNVGENMTCAMLNIPFGAFQISDYANDIRRTGMREVIAIANKLGIDLGEAEVAAQEKCLAGLPFENKPSTLQDLEAGKLTEVDMFAGETIRLGEKYGVPTPMATMYYKSIKAKEDMIEKRHNKN